MTEKTKTQYRFEDVVAHASPMALLDTIEHWDSDTLQANVTIQTDSPFADEQGVPTWVGIEYMAQTIAAYAGVQAREQDQSVKIGFLVGSRRYNCNSSYFPIGCTLSVQIQQEIRGDNGLSVFSCNIHGKHHSNDIEASASLNVFQPNDPERFLAGEEDL